MSKKLLYLDTETTGNEEKDCLVQIAYAIKTDIETPLIESEIVSELYKPPIPISVESMAVHHITQKMVAEKPEFKWSKEHAYLKNLFAENNVILVAHNAKFDVAMIKKEGLSPSDVICTLRVARYLDKENKIPRYNLQYLRYFLGIEIDAVAHDAKGDVLVLDRLFERLYKKILDECDGLREKALAKMIDISSRPSLLYKFTFGKYNDKSVEYVRDTDPGYLDWMLGQKLANNANDEDWIYTLKHYLGKLQ